eukprot:355544-Chlamydomonas_euryale.AAC.3
MAAGGITRPMIDTHQIAFAWIAMYACMCMDSHVSLHAHGEPCKLACAWIAMYACMCMDSHVSLHEHGEPRKLACAWRAP